MANQKEQLESEISLLARLVENCEQFRDRDIQWARYLLHEACQRRRNELAMITDQNNRYAVG